MSETLDGSRDIVGQTLREQKSWKKQDEWLRRLKGGSNVHIDAVGVVSSLAMLIAFSALLLLLSVPRPRVVLETRVFEQE